MNFSGHLLPKPRMEVGIHAVSDILGSKEAKTHPQMGNVEIESPDHYRQLLKEFDMEEADDPQGGNRDWLGEKIERQKAEFAKPRNTEFEIPTEEQVSAAIGRDGGGLL